MPTRPITRRKTWRRSISRANCRRPRCNWCAPIRTISPAGGGGGGGGAQFATDETARYEIRPRGNSVSHEDEMMKVASNQMDYEAVTSLYTHSLDLIKLAAGKE